MIKQVYLLSIDTFLDSFIFSPILKCVNNIFFDNFNFDRASLKSSDNYWPKPEFVRGP